jgi:hypothetical protein
LTPADAAAKLYLADLTSSLWDYRERAFGYAGTRFDRAERDPFRPPVFLREYEDDNVIVRPGAFEAEAGRVRSATQRWQRHRWFRSMRSSQALAQSLFANLRELGRLDALAGLRAEDDLVASPWPAFFSDVGGWSAELEYAVDYLGEPRSTSVDVLLTGASRVAVECKLAEADVGTCSRPRRPRTDPDHCNGSYAVQMARTAPCALTERGVKYWDYIPDLFDISSAIVHRPCPLHTTYQLVRNVLAACVTANGPVRSGSAHALLLYDARNPSFRPGGAGAAAFEAVTARLRHPGLLRRCSWQRVLGWIGRHHDLDWLVREVSAKYGFIPETPRSP